MQTFYIPRGEPRDDVLAKLIRCIHGLPEHKVYVVQLKERKPERSNPQNNALWGVAYKTLRDETGNDPDDMHTYFCGEYFGWVEYRIMDQVRKRPRRTTTRDSNGKRNVISKMDFADFYSFIQQRSAETVGVYVPDPNEDVVA